MPQIQELLLFLKSKTLKLENLRVETGVLQPSEWLATVARAQLSANIELLIVRILNLIKRSPNVARITDMDPVSSRCGTTLTVRLKPRCSC